MQIKNAEILSLIEAIGEHYRTNISNRYIRKAFLSLTLDAGQWDLIETLTEKAGNFRYQGYHFDELYDQILAISKFIYQVRKEVVPNLRYLLQGGSVPGKATESDRVFKDMAVTNFGSNLKILADQVNLLYMKTVAIDKEASEGKPPVFSKIPELQEIGRYLVE